MVKRKPRQLKNNTNLYPRIEVEYGQIYIQAVPSGVWKKVPVDRAKYLKGRLSRAVRYVEDRRGRIG